ncbi:MAG TPA: hypothetical protein VG994_02630 [Steroidobacteraceae bacterium]|nr:hypothetical protein [Steroidobacteraceae bacterium]
MRVRTDNGKYTFDKRNAVIDILRHGEPWAQNVHNFNAIHSLMAELDAARVVIAAARQSQDPAVQAALRQHAALVDDREPPSEWAGDK